MVFGLIEKTAYTLIHDLLTNGYTYAQIAEAAGVDESMIRSINDHYRSRRYRGKKVEQ